MKFFILLVWFAPFTMSETCQSLVVYDESNVVFKRFSEKQQQVTIGDHVINLSQDWKQGGVAGVLWDSALVLSEYILQNKGKMRKIRSILELGAGLGLPSIVAGKIFDVDRIVATDQKKSLPLLKKNVDLNSETVSVMELDWANLEGWNSGEFDLILGADLVYDKQMFEPLQFALLHFIAPNTTCLLSSKIRYPKDRKFFHQLAKTFNVSEIYYDASVDVRIFQVTQKLT